MIRLASRSRQCMLSESASMSSLDQSFKTPGLDPGVDDSDHLFDAQAAVCLSVCDYTTRWSYVTSLVTIELLGFKRCLHVYEGSKRVKAE
jgi:hypothetical protein